VAFSDPAFAALTWDIAHKGTPVDLTGYRETWRDSFNSLSTITSDDRKLTGVNWYAPGRRDSWGKAVFKPMTAVPSPYSCRSSQLFIRMETVNGVNQSGHIQGVNNVGTGSGKVQTMGYFEAGLKFPKGFGTWPAFWLISKDPAAPRVEIDIIEGYGGNDWDGHHATIHLARTYHRPQYTNLSKINPATGQPWWPVTQRDMFDGQYHTYAGMLDEEAVKIYYDNKECCRFPMTDYFRTPLYMLLTLAMYEADAAKFVGPKDMGANYVRTLAKI
jgi:hypothetical protein